MAVGVCAAAQAQRVLVWCRDKDGKKKKKGDEDGSNDGSNDAEGDEDDVEDEVCACVCARAVTSLGIHALQPLQQQSLFHVIPNAMTVLCAM